MFGDRTVFVAEHGLGLVALVLPDLEVLLRHARNGPLGAYLS